MAPWTPGESSRFTRKAKTRKAKRQWSKVSNSVLRRGGSEASAIRVANAAVKRRRRKRQGKSRD